MPIFGLNKECCVQVIFKLIFLYKTVRDILSCNISTVHVSENVQNKIYNLQIRLEQFTHHTKKGKMEKVKRL